MTAVHYVVEGRVVEGRVAEGRDDGPVVVLAGSLGSSLEMWDPQVAVLGEHFRVIRYDHRGHGGSPVVAAPFDIEDLGADVVELLDRLDVDRAHFVGLSLGGMVGMWLASHAPERVDRLALICTSPLLGPASNWTDRAATVRASGTAAVADAVVERWFTPAYAASNPVIVERLRAMVTGTSAEGYAACCEAIARMDQTGTLADIKAPTLAIAGADDPATPPEHLQGIVDRVPDGRLAVLARAAHLASVEQADAVNALLLDHLHAGEAA